MFKRFSVLFMCVLSNFGYANCCYTRWDVPLHEGGFYYGFRWLYPLPTVSDGDLQYATALTLTGNPPSLDQNQNLTARVQQIAPDYTSAYRANLGYVLPCTNSDIDLQYFYFRASDSDSVTSPVRSATTYQFLQNFLGGGYVSGEAKDTQRIDQVDLLVGTQYLLDCQQYVHPFYGVSFAYIRRHLDVEFADFSIPPDVNPITATLTGSLNSRYWGVGPTIGADFTIPLLPCLELTRTAWSECFRGKCLF